MGLQRAANDSRLYALLCFADEGDSKLSRGCVAMCVVQGPSKPPRKQSIVDNGRRSAKNWFITAVVRRHF